jgi:hypothetical protein
MGVVQRNASKENLPYLCNLFLNTPPPALSGGDWATAVAGEEEIFSWHLATAARTTPDCSRIFSHTMNTQKINYGLPSNFKSGQRL